MAFEQFLPDYFAECEQHLASIRGVLLELDALPTGTPLDRVRLQDLLRALHTLKGLSGMVGLVPAERVAHALEDALRSWRGAGGALDAAAVQTLFSGTRLLEACITSKRD
ncbi:MAG TPA: Hpt domain-containing protein, partial [Longimicrobiales bacterium]